MLFVIVVSMLHKNNKHTTTIRSDGSALVQSAAMSTTPFVYARTWTTAVAAVPTLCLAVRVASVLPASLLSLMVYILTHRVVFGHELHRS